MWDRKLVKAKGKAAFKANYWHCVLVAFILSLLSVTFTGGTSTSSTTQTTGGDGVSTAIAITFGFVALAATAIGILVFNPLSVGCQRFFLKNSRGEGDNLGDIGFAFRENYGNVTGTMFFYGLYVFLWALLLIIPGIIKSYEYRMIPYLLAENPNITREEAFAESKRIMNGNKWSAFVYDLSFIGWILLSIFTAGILLLFYVNPYKYSSDAELYLTLTGRGSEEMPAAEVVDNSYVSFEGEEESK